MAKSSIISRVANAVKTAYGKADRAVGGYLPGGSTPQQVSQSKSSSPSSSSSASSAPTNSTRPSSGPSVSSSGGGSSGGQTISGINLPPQPTGPLPYQTRGTSTDLAPGVPDTVKSVNVGQTYGGGSSGGISSSATGASGSALNQGGGPASPSMGGGSSYGPASGNINIGPEYDVRTTMSGGEKYASVDKNFFGGLLPGGTKLSRDSLAAGGENIRDAAQQAFGAGPYASPKPITAFTKFVDPFDVLKNPQDVGEIRGFAMGGTYTGQYNPSTGNYDVPDQYKGKTGYENAQIKAIINPDLAKTDYALSDAARAQAIGEATSTFKPQAEARFNYYQGEINAGRLSVGQATPLYESDLAKINQQFQVSAQQRYSEILTPKLNAAAGFRSELSGLRKDVYFNPSTIITGGALVAASFAGGSSIAVVRAVGGAANAFVAVEGGSNVYEGIANKNYVQAGIGAAMFALGTYGTLKYAANEVTIARIQGVTEQAPVRVSTYRSAFNGQENMFIDRSVYKQATGSAQAYTRTEVISRYNPQARTFDIVSGTSETVGRTTDFWSGKLFNFGSYSTFSGVGKAVPAGSLYAKVPGAAFNAAPESYTPSLTRLQITNQYQYSAIGKVGQFENIAVKQTGRQSTQIYGALVGNNPATGQLEFASGPLQRGTFAVDQVIGKGWMANTGFRPGVFDITAYGNINKVGGGGTVIDFRPFPSSGLRGNISPGSAFGGAASSAQVTQGVAGQLEVPMKLIESFAAPASSLSQASAASAGVAAIARSGQSYAPLASIFAGTGTYEQTQDPVQYAIQLPILQNQQLQGRQQVPALDFFPPATAFAGGQSQFQIPGQTQIPGLQNPQIPLLESPFSGLIPGSGNPFNPSGFFGDIIPGLPFNFELDFGGAGAGPIPGGKQRLKYTPDFESLVFGIKGKAPAGGESPNPFAARPITKGFSFAFEEGPNFGDMFKAIKLPGMPGQRRRRK